MPSLRTLVTQAIDGNGGFNGDTYLYTLVFPQTAPQGLGVGECWVEGFAAIDTLHCVSQRDVVVLSTQPEIDFNTLYGQVAQLQIRLLDGSRYSVTGLVVGAARLGSDGGLTRYQLRIAPWLWLLGRRSTHRVWRNKTTVEIVDDVFDGYNAFSAWRWSPEVARYLRPARPRRHCEQHQETDLAFISRLLAEEGLSWRFEESPGRAHAPAGHTLVLFADSTHAAACPEDLSSQHEHGIHFHGAHAIDAPDGVQALAQAHMARAEVWQGRSIVRTFTGGAGTHFRLRDSPHLVPHQGQGIDPSLVLLSVTSVGINNLSRTVHQALDAQLGRLKEQLQQSLQGLQASQDAPAGQGVDDASGSGARRANLTSVESDAEPLDLLPLDDVFIQAQASGYANRFEAAVTNGDNAVPWRPVLQDGTGLRLNPSPVERD